MSGLPEEDHTIDAEGFGVCPDCSFRMQCGPGKWANLEKTHRGSQVCKDRKAKRDKEKGLKDGSILALWGRTSKTKPVPSTTRAPAPLTVGPAQLVVQTASTSRSRSVEIVEAPVRKSTLPSHGNTAAAAVNFIKKLKGLATRLCEDVDSRIIDIQTPDPLAYFNVDPTTFDDPSVSSENLWEVVVNGIMKAGLGWGTSLEISTLLRTDGTGMMGLVRFVEFFIIRRGVSEALFEGKLRHLIEGLQAIYPDNMVCSSTLDPISVEAPKAQSTVAAPKEQATVRKRYPEPRLVGCCKGFQLSLPQNANAFDVYPFGLHGSDSAYALPWRCEIGPRELILRAWTCTNVSSSTGSTCDQCQNLGSNAILRGIIKRFTEGVHENSSYIFHGTQSLVEILRRKDGQIAFLRTRGLTQAKTLLARSTALSDHKRFMVALASNKYGNVERLVRTALKQKRGIRGILSLYQSAAEGVYHPKNFEEEDDMRGLLLWKLGGNRIAGIAHRALGLPSVTTLRHRQIMPPLIASHSTPTVNEIRKNMEACFESIADVLAKRGTVNQVVLMLDELATEKRMRWDDLTNHILGLCREHGMLTALEFNTIDDIKELFASVERGEVHYAAEATVGALGMLSEETRIYAGRPVLISGDCKRETGEEHSVMIQTILNAAEAVKEKTRIRVVSVATDGETRRGVAMIHLTFKKQLEPTSPIHELLVNLIFMDFHVGHDDITCDKDWKHIFKRFRNLFQRVRGLVIQDIRITPTIIQSHLKSSGLSATHVNTLFNPDDQQDVKLAFDMLKDIWSLPALSAHSNPSVLGSRNVLCILGKLLYHMVFPYLCTELSLSEQLEHLSAAAHLALVLYNTDGKEFIPTLLYQDLAIMIKNVYFCVAKAKIDDPDGKFFIILLGTDRLEELFGILRTMIGNDANLDILQLASRLTGTTQVSNILARYPHWDRAPRRLKLPAISRTSAVLSNSVDHIKPASWKGNVYLKNVTLLTAWKRGRHLVENECNFAVPILKRAQEQGNIHILAPRGKLLVNLPVEEIGEDDSLDISESTRPSLDISGNTRTSESTVSADMSRISIEDATRVEIEDSFLEEDANLEDHAPSTSTSQASTVNADTPPQRHFDRYVIYEGERMLKSRALSLYSKKLGKSAPSSTDRLKRVQEVERYTPSKGGPIILPSGDSSEEEPLLMIQDPVSTVVRCEGLLFLCIGEVNGIKIDSDGTLTSVPYSELAELEKITISIQILGLQPSTSADDPSLLYDWRSYRIQERTIHVPGKYIQPVDPKLVSRGIGQMFYLFQGSFLVALAASVLGELNKQNVRELGQIPSSKDFPYREGSGKACFACRSTTGEFNNTEGTTNSCSLCTPNFEFTSKTGHRVLEHVGAHIIHDSNIIREHEPCGLCLLPPDKCRIFLSKGAHGTVKINLQASTGCARRDMHNFRYSVAAESKPSSPCSNVPVQCPICPEKTSPAVWKYNLEYHMRSKHKTATLERYSSLWTLSRFEKGEMSRFWKNRHDIVIRRPGKSKDKQDIIISEAHVSTLALLPEDIYNEQEQDNAKISDHNSNKEHVVDEDLDSGPDSESEDELMSEESDNPKLSGNDPDWLTYYEEDTINDHVGESNECSTVNGDTDHVTEQMEQREPPGLIIVDQPPQIVLTPPAMPLAPITEGIVVPADPVLSGRTRRKASTRYNLDELRKCTCDKIAKDFPEGGIVECKNNNCVTKWYHLVCVDLELAPRGWMCETCLADGVGRASKRGRRG